MIWDQLTSEEVKDLNKDIPIILPIAATEQHGPHLPLATDRMIGEHFANKIHETIPDQVLILPTVGIGCSDHHMDFSGTLTLSHAVFINQVEQIIKSVAHHGFYKVILLNSHGGNLGAGQVVVEKVGYEHPELQIVMTSWWQIARDQLLKITDAGFGGVGHAGEFETSLMMLIAPDLVRNELIERGKNESSFDWANADLLHSPRASWYRTMKQLTPNGIYGDPRAASAAKGKQITAVVLDSLQKIIDDLI